MLVIERHHVRRAHGAFIPLTAYACAIAQFHGRCEAAFARKVIVRVHWDGVVLRPIAKVFRHRWRIDDFAGIHPVFGIESGLHVLESSVDLRPEQLFVEVAAGKTVAVLAAHAAAEFDDEVCNLVGHIFHDLNIAGIFRVDEGPDVKTADAGMAVVAGAGVVLVNDVAESDKKFRQL